MTTSDDLMRSQRNAGDRQGEEAGLASAANGNNPALWPEVRLISVTLRTKGILYGQTSVKSPTVLQILAPENGSVVGKGSSDNLGIVDGKAIGPGDHCGAAMHRVGEVMDHTGFFDDFAQVRDSGPRHAKSPRPGLYRPVKTPVTLRLNADLVRWFKDRAQSGGYQTEINRVLRRYVMETQSHG